MNVLVKRVMREIPFLSRLFTKKEGSIPNEFYSKARSIINQIHSNFRKHECFELRIQISEKYIDPLQYIIDIARGCDSNRVKAYLDLKEDVDYDTIPAHKSEAVYRIGSGLRSMNINLIYSDGEVTRFMSKDKKIEVIIMAKLNSYIIYIEYKKSVGTQLP